jgi:hypothetical protein
VGLLLSTVTLAMLSQYSKALNSMLVTPLPMVMVARLVHFPKA